jgi:hypothetical protein
LGEGRGGVGVGKREEVVERVEGLGSRNMFW